MLSFGGLSGAALANELDILNEPPPGTQHVIDDAGVLNKTTRRALNDELSRLEVRSPASQQPHSFRAISPCRQLHDTRRVSHRFHEI